MARRLGVGFLMAIAMTMTSIIPAPSALAGPDPLADAQARITAAQVAADEAAADYDIAQARYYQLQDDARRTERRIASLRKEVLQLAAIARARAVIAYMGGSLGRLDAVLGSSSDALDTARSAVLADRANAAGDVAMEQLAATTDDLHARERALQQELVRQGQALKDLRARQVGVQRTLEDATRAEQDLRARLERARRIEEYAALVRQAQAVARARAELAAARAADSARARAGQEGIQNGGGAPIGGSAGQIIGSGSWVCPVQGVVSFTDTYGSPRSGGRSHKGVDMFAARGTPTVAVVAGSVFFQGDPLGGLAAYVNGNDGNTYYYAHLNDYTGSGRSVAAGEVIGHVGNTGDASDAPPHLHFEIRPGGPNGPRINPYPTTRAHC